MNTKTLRKKPKESVSDHRKKRSDLIDALEGKALENEIDKRLSKLEETFKKYSGF